MPRIGKGTTTGSAASWWVYLCECADASLYCGIALDPEARLAKHNAGQGAKYTRSRLPVTLRYKERVGSLSAALKREAEIKRMHRWEKELLGCF